MYREKWPEHSGQLSKDTTKTWETRRIYCHIRHFPACNSILLGKQTNVHVPFLKLISSIYADIRWNTIALLFGKLYWLIYYSITFWKRRQCLVCYDESLTYQYVIFHSYRLGILRYGAVYLIVYAYIVVHVRTCAYKTICKIVHWHNLGIRTMDLMYTARLFIPLHYKRLY